MRDLLIFCHNSASGIGRSMANIICETRTRAWVRRNDFNNTICAAWLSTPLCLRQHGTLQFIQLCVFSLYERKIAQREEEKCRCESSHL
jgi:hypothetical protein